MNLKDSTPLAYVGSQPFLLTNAGLTWYDYETEGRIQH